MADDLKSDEFKYDVFLSHSSKDTAAVNTSDRDRVAVFFRLWLRGLEERRWHHLTNIWDGWRI
jgi:hypothetical protein